jgi:tRNA(Ile)-lysidine synthase
VRAAILPVLRAENPSIDAGLARMARAMRELSDGLEWATSRAESLCDTRRARGATSVDAEALVRLPRAIGKRLLARLADELDASLAATHLDGALDLAAGSAGSPRSLAAPGLAIVRADTRLELRPRTAADVVGIRLLVEVSSQDRVRVRTFRAGDRMRPLRLGGRSRKLSDLYADARVPRSARAHAVVVVQASGSNGGEIVWAEHVGPAFGTDVRVSLTRLDPRVNTEPLESKGDTK